MTTWVGIDVGGTFTDVVVYTDDGRSMTTVKVQSTPEDPSLAFVEGLQLGLERAGAHPSSVTRLVHGSTVGINAFLQRRGAKVGVLCTRGFEDTLTIGRAKRKQMYEFRIGPQTPGFLAERAQTVGISTRLNAQGNLLQEADSEEIDAAVAYLVEEQGVQAIAINLLFAFTNPAVEQALAERIRDRYPDVTVSCGSSLDPRVREYERLVVTALDAYIRPLIAKYVAVLRDQVRDLGIPAKLFMMESHGGVIDAELLEDRSVSVLLSGLAGGAIGAAKVGEAIGNGNLLSVDMGGTSTDVVLVTDGEVGLSDEGAVGGFDVRLPAVEVHTVGAGGGSIARVVSGGGLNVGPISAGAAPGPACYGQGGDQPTVTDANVVLGYLPAGELADGSLTLDRSLAESALHEHVAEPLQLELSEAAWAIHQVAVASMANAARVVSIRRGIDVRDYALFPCGGAGPMHACGIADELGITNVVIPAVPGVLAAYGLLAADTVTNSWRTHVASLESTELLILAESIEEAVASSIAQTRTKGPDTTSIQTRVLLDMRYSGQSHELGLEVDPGDLRAGDAPGQLRRRFDELHLRRYGQSDRASDCVITGFKVSVSGFRNVPQPGFEKVASHAVSRTTRFFDPTKSAFIDAPVYRRDAIAADLTGPAVVEQSDSTIVLQRGWRAVPLPYGALHLIKDDLSLSTMK